MGWGGRNLFVMSFYELKRKKHFSICAFFFLLQRLLNMHIYDNDLYAKLEDLNA